MKFGRTLNRHIEECQPSGCRPEDYIAYSMLKQAIKRECSEEEFQELFNKELDRFLNGMRNGALQQDPMYVVMNRAALDKISKKFDKYCDGNVRSSNWQKTTSSMKSVLKSNVSNWALIPPDVKPEDNQGSSKRLQLLLAGGVSGMVSRTMTAPLYRIKIVLQAGVAIPPPLQSRPWGNIVGTGRIRRAAQYIYKDSGVTGFWRGNGASVLKVVPESAMKFFMYDFIKNAVIKNRNSDNKNQGTLSFDERLFCGCMAGGISQLSVYPLEVTKTRLAVSTTGQYNGIYDCIRKTVTEEGVFALYRGVIPALMGLIPAVGIDLAVYNTLRDMYTERERRLKLKGGNPKQVYLQDARVSQVPLPYSVMFGAVSACCGAVVGFPLSLIRTRLMAQGMPGRPIEYEGMLHCGISVVREAGVLGLYRGLLPALLKTVPGISIGYGAFEGAKRVAGINT
eukprot:m.259770 g.259770  ORF g.259770 m.259770 type:complete len:452 (+) comp16208_c1_seq3:197-1552(+)